MDIKEKKITKRIFQGIVVSDAMDKTIIARVEGLKKHGKYHKYYKYFKKFKVHDPENKYKEGDHVQFVECRPISKEKRWKVLY